MDRVDDCGIYNIKVDNKPFFFNDIKSFILEDNTLYVDFKQFKLLIKYPKLLIATNNMIYTSRIDFIESIRFSIGILIFFKKLLDKKPLSELDIGGNIIRYKLIHKIEKDGNNYEFVFDTCRIRYTGNTLTCVGDYNWILTTSILNVERMYLVLK